MRHLPALRYLPVSLSQEKENMKKLTATQEKSRKKKFKKILETLQSGTTPEILEACKKLKEHGDAEAVPVMIDLLINHSDPEVVTEMKKIFKGLNDHEAITPILNAVEQDIGTKNKIFLLSAIWESGLNAGKHIDQLTQISTQAGNEEIIEILTVVDYVDNEIPEKTLTENLKLIRTAVEKEKNS